MKSLRQQEGYLLIDHRSSPGISELNPDASGIPNVPAGATYESATFTCSHCHRVVIVNPLRNRPHDYCPKCDHYLCGSEICLKECNPMTAVLDKLQEEAGRLLNKQEY